MPRAPHLDVVDLYDRTADAWAAARGDTLREGPWLDRLVAGIAPGAAALDAGCGSGDPIGGALLRRGFRVTGVDAAPRMVALAAARHPEGDFLVGDLRTLDLGRTFDAVVAWFVLFHLTPDAQRAALPRIAGHVRPGGSLLFTTGPDASEVIGTWQGEPLYHASLDPEAYRALLAAGGLEVVVHVLDDPEQGGATVWLARRPVRAR